MRRNEGLRFDWAAAAQKMTTSKADAGLSRIEPIFDDMLDSASTLLVLPDEITHAQAAGCLHMLLTTVGAESRAPTITFVVDATPLTHFDSSALAVLLECRREVLHTGRRFAVRGMHARLAELARLYGVAELLTANPAA
jgi:phospholipid transport system transporter-binding protein